jgi:hypothetical protein
MTDRTLRTVVAGLTGLLVLVIAVTLLIVVGRNSSGTASPSAPPMALGSPSIGATLTPIESAPPSPSANADATATPATEASQSVAPSGSPGATALATLTFVDLKLDADQDAGGDARVITFRSDGAGTVTAKLASTSPQGKTHMCFLVGTKELGCKDWRSGTFTGKTSQAHATWKVTLLGSDFDAPTVDLTVTFQAVAPAVKIEHARFDGTAYPDTNGIQARFVARAAGEVRLVADWGGHPFLYQVDLFDERAGPVNETQSGQALEPTTNAKDAMPVTPGTWRLVLRNSEDGFGTTDLTATISWP